MKKIINNLYYTIKDKFNKCYLTKQDLILMVDLINSNVNINDILDLIINKKNIKAINQIKLNLINGININDFFGEYLPKKYRDFFNSFITITSFAKAIEYSIDMVENLKNNKLFWIKNILPSILLFIMCFLGIWLFQNFGINMIASLANTFNQEVQWLATLDIVLTVFIVLMLIIIIFIFCIIIGMKLNGVYMVITSFLSSFYSNNILSLYVSYQFAYYYYHFNDLGLSTIDILNNLINNSSDLIKYCSIKIKRQCINGYSFIDAISLPVFDYKLINFIKMGQYSDLTNNKLKIYCQLCSNLINNKMKYIAKSMQLFCYISIGLIVICIYQVLLLPMSIITTM